MGLNKTITYQFKFFIIIIIINTISCANSKYANESISDSCSDYRKLLDTVFFNEPSEELAAKNGGIIFIWNNSDTLCSMIIDSVFMFRFIEFYEQHMWREMINKKEYFVLVSNDHSQCTEPISEKRYSVLKKAIEKRNRLENSEYYGITNYEPLVYKYSIQTKEFGWDYFFYSPGSPPLPHK